MLNHLTRVGDGRTPQAMASAFQTPKATMTHQVGVLERHGLVESRPNPRDGRSKQVWLTDAGRTLRTDTIASFAKLVERLQDGIDRSTVEALLPDLERVRTYLDENRE